MRTSTFAARPRLGDVLRDFDDRPHQVTAVEQYAHPDYPDQTWVIVTAADGWRRAMRVG